MKKLIFLVLFLVPLSCIAAMQRCPVVVSCPKNGDATGCNPLIPGGYYISDTGIVAGIGYEIHEASIRGGVLHCDYKAKFPYSYHMKGVGYLNNYKPLIEYGWKKLSDSFYTCNAKDNSCYFNYEA